MNKFVKIAVLGLLLVLLIGGGIYFKQVSIGSYVVDEVAINKVTVGSNSVVIDGMLTSSGKAYKEYEYKLVDTELYINIREVLVSNKYKEGTFKINVPVNGANINNIYLSDNSKTKVIYSKNNGDGVN